MKLPFSRPDPMEPPEEYVYLCEGQPVARVETPDGRSAWLVTSYDTAAGVLSDTRFALTPPGLDLPGNDTLFQDGEPHARLRRLVGKAFTARRVATLRPRIEEVAGEYVGEISESGPPVDLVDGLAAPLAIVVIGELLGVEVGHREHFRGLADAVSAGDPFGFDTNPDALAAAAQAWESLMEYASGLVAAKREALGDDLVSDLINVRDAEDGQLFDRELVGMIASLVAAGYVTARNAIAVGTMQLIKEEQLRLLAEDDDRLQATVEEVLRRQSGLIGEPFPRYAQENVELAGEAIAAGDLVLVRLEAANRDPRRFPDPDRFLLERDSSKHLAFGRGPHHCLGAALARVEIAAAFRALARRLPLLRVVGGVEDVKWNNSPVDPGPESLFVTW